MKELETVPTQTKEAVMFYFVPLIMAVVIITAISVIYYGPALPPQD